MPAQPLLTLLGLERTPNNHPEKWISGLGGFIGIILVSLVTTAILSPGAAVLVVSSMGASAVLLFAAPHGPLSQPWPFLAGHLVSALVGVTCQRFIPTPTIAAPVAVGLTIVMMYYGRCIHPPGGATGLTAVIGGPAIHALGYSYVLVPVLLNAAILLLVTVAFNYPFAWRRYPAALSKSRVPLRHRPEMSHEHLAYAVQQMGSLVNISEADLAEIYSLAIHHAHGTHLHPSQIQVGKCYTHSEGDPHATIRQVVDELPNTDPQNDLVLYWTLDGPPPFRTAVCSRTAFALWARSEVSQPNVFEAGLAIH